MKVHRDPSVTKLILQDVFAAVQMGIEHQQAGNFKQAESIYEQIIENNPDNADALHLRGLIAYQRGEHQKAVDLIRKAIQVDNSISGFHYNLGNVFKSQNKLQDAADCYQESLHCDPENLDALNNLGNALREQGRIEDGLKQFYRVLKIRPDCAEFRSNFLLTLNYRSDMEPEKIYEEHLNWGNHHAESLKGGIKTFANDITNPYRPLRIGYVSPDFRRHSVVFFIEAVLEAHDRSNFKIICYSNVSRPDAVTERMQCLSHKWREIRHMGDADVAGLIRKDKIDILVDLAGHMGNNRLPVFALKPAPVQVTYIGYPNTTGLSTIDYRLTDGWADPPGTTEKYYSEKLIRLPCGFLCFRPPDEGPAIGQLPASRKGIVTFGSFNNIAKVTPETVQTWSAILEAVPLSRLFLKFRTLADPSTCQRIKELFIANGIPADRINTISHIPSHEGHLALYNEIDIALDPFPYNGTTTTCEALWMGVPVVTLAGKTHISRVGVSLLSVIGLKGLIADSPANYKNIVVRLSKDLNRLQTLRTGLRQKILESPLIDADRFTRSLEDVYRDMWKNYCSRFDTKGSISRPGNTDRTIPLASINGTCRENKNNRSDTDSMPAVSMDIGIKSLIDRVYEKRRCGQVLSAGDLMLMLADTILDQRFFQSEHWKWRYGGVRYYPRDGIAANPEKILVLQWPAALGDAAMAAPFYARLRMKYPQSRIELLGNHTTQSIYEGSGFIDTFMENPLEPFLDQACSGQTISIQELITQITELTKKLASEEFDLLINLQILPMSAVIAKLSFAKEIWGMTLSDDGMPVIIGDHWHPYLFGISSNLMRVYNRMHRSAILKRLTGLTRDAPFDPATFISRESARSVQQFFDDQGVDDSDILIGINPMASSPIKTWKQYDGLIRALWKRYGAKIILFGSGSERGAISTIIGKSGVPAIQATDFNINELMAAISGCDLIITNDTGPMHLASMLNRKIIALFGPTITREVGPWSENHITLQSTICSECFQSACELQNTCMDHISIQDVICAADFFLRDATEAKERISSRAKWLSPGDELQFFNTLDQTISLQYSAFLNIQKSPLMTLGSHQKELDYLENFCGEFRAKIKNALMLLENNDTPDQLAVINNDISSNCGFLKTILVFNDMKYLDKRNTIQSDLRSYGLYYKGILEDIERFISA